MSALKKIARQSAQRIAAAEEEVRASAAGAGEARAGDPAPARPDTDPGGGDTGGDAAPGGTPAATGLQDVPDGTASGSPPSATTGGEGDASDSDTGAAAAQETIMQRIERELDGASKAYLKEVRDAYNRHLGPLGSASLDTIQDESREALGQAEFEIEDLAVAFHDKVQEVTNSLASVTPDESGLTLDDYHARIQSIRDGTYRERDTIEAKAQEFLKSVLGEDAAPDAHPEDAAEPDDAEEWGEASTASPKAAQSAEAPGATGQVPAPAAQPEAHSAGNTPAIPSNAMAIPPTDEDEAARLTASNFEGTVSQGPPARDFEAPAAGAGPSSEAARREWQRAFLAGLKRPDDWPTFMPFPPHNKVELLLSSRFGPEQQAAFLENMEQLSRDMVTRAQQIDDWLLRKGDQKLAAGIRREREKSRKSYLSTLRNRLPMLGKTETDDVKASGSDVEDEVVVNDQLYINDPHRGIRFATLLSVQENALTKPGQDIVAAWGHRELRTRDGGSVIARGDELCVPRRVASGVTPQAAMAMVLEAQQRGWETIKVTGNIEFCHHVKQAAAQVGMGADLRIRNGGLICMRDHLSPNVPRFYDAEIRDKAAERYAGPKGGPHLPGAPDADPYSSEAMSAADDLDKKGASQSATHPGPTGMM